MLNSSVATVWSNPEDDRPPRHHKHLRVPWSNKCFWNSLVRYFASRASKVTAARGTQDPLSFCLGLSSLISWHCQRADVIFLSLLAHSSFILYPYCFFYFFCEMKESSKEIRKTVRMSKEANQRRSGRIRKAFNFEWMLSDGSHVSALWVEYNEAEEKHVYLNAYSSKKHLWKCTGSTKTGGY